MTWAPEAAIAASPLASSPLEQGQGLVYDGRPVLNVYPYSRAGRLLYDVRPYDDLGRAITLQLGPDQLRRITRTANGAQVQNAYPIRYYQPGTHLQRVAHPGAGPSISAPRIVTPPPAP